MCVYVVKNTSQKYAHVQLATNRKKEQKKKKKSQAFTLELKERGKITIVEERRSQLVPN